MGSLGDGVREPGGVRGGGWGGGRPRGGAREGAVPRALGGGREGGSLGGTREGGSLIPPPSPPHPLSPEDARLCYSSPPSPTAHEAAPAPTRRCAGRSARCVDSAELHRQPCSSVRRQQRSAEVASRLLANLSADPVVGSRRQAAAWAQEEYFSSVGSWCPAILNISTHLDDVRVSVPDSHDLSLVRQMLTLEHVRGVSPKSSSEWRRRIALTPGSLSQFAIFCTAGANFHAVCRHSFPDFCLTPSNRKSEATSRITPRGGGLWLTSVWPSKATPPMTGGERG